VEGGIHRSAAVGYERAPAAYELGRPGYPQEAVAMLAERLDLRPGTVVLDLAAGTGKLTRALAATGADVVAVEPVAEMRAALTDSLPAVQALAGAAEDIPLGDGSVDAVAVGQAFHWFRGDEALAEIHRVLRPGGRLALLWNLRDEAVPWVAGLTRIMEPYRGDAPRAASGAWRRAFERTSLFEALDTATCRQVQRLTVEGVLARVASVSFIAALPESRRARVLTEVQELVGAEPVDLPYVTELYWTTRRAGARS
jgi:ubiquinone/menaquinone biosynthesis C-methylase UbiE